MNNQRPKRVPVDGWLILDKPVGMTSTHAVSRLKHIFQAKKAGHAGTLDPLASGILPIAFGEATKTVPFVQNGEKAYRFTVTWGAETNTDDSDGKVVHTSDLRPSQQQVADLLPRFIGTIQQVPPAFSAIKIAGERAYDMAREGETVDIPARPVTIHALDLVGGDETCSIIEARCGKGTYVRAIARDLGRMLGCFGHVTQLRRTRVGPFMENEAIPLAELAESPDTAMQFMLSVEVGLIELPCVVVDRNGAARLRRGQSLILRGRDAPMGGMAYASCGGVPVAFGPVNEGQLVPHRVFNLSI